MTDREPIPNPDRNKIIQHGDIQVPAGEIFSTRELNRLSEVQANSPERHETKPEPVRRLSRVGEAVLNLIRPVGAPRISIVRR